jgi:C_GCAxxG_C_C family probable redox protein
MLAVGEYVFGNVDDQTLKMTTGFAGGIGMTHQELCGALSAGIMIIGALYGRTQPNEDDSLCQTLATNYRNRFVQKLGSINCGELRAERYGSRGQEPCSVLVERVALLLLDILSEKDKNNNEEDNMRC